jgi:GntR family transcriptional regulator, vanillate catabolism transcriptional regulator
VARGNNAGSLTTKATLGVRELVFGGTFGPGDRVPEIELAERLGVSRTPLRIALTTLAHEGLLEQLPGGGFVVRAFSLGDIADAIELRGVLEGTAARFAAERLELPASLAALEDAAAALDEVVRKIGGDSEEIERYVTLNNAFHDGLVALARSPNLTRALANVNALPFATPSAILASHAVRPRSLEILRVAQYHHWALIEAIRERHGTRAEEIAREHARLSRVNLDLVLEDREALEQIPGAPLLTEAARTSQSPRKEELWAVAGAGNRTF